MERQGRADLSAHLDVIAILLAVGLLGGFVAGLFGIGGGTVLVPAFLLIFPSFGVPHDIVMHTAVGTCLALIVPAAITSSVRQRRMGNLDPAVLRSWVPGVVVGVVIGSLVANAVSTTALKIGFTAYLVFCTEHSWRDVRKPAAPADDGHDGLPHGPVKIVGGGLIGTLSVMLGVGGGTFTVPFLRWFHYPLKKAIAISTASGLFIGAGGAIGALVHGWGVPGRPEFFAGYVSVLAFVILGPLMMVVSPLGSRTANALPERTLARVYLAFLATLSVTMIVQLVRSGFGY